MAEEVGQAYVSIVPSLAGFSAKLKSQLASELRGIDPVVGEAGHRAGGSFGDRLREGIRTRLAGIGAMLKTGLVVGAAAAVAGLGAITTFGLKSAAQLEQTQIGIESLLGSAEDAKAFIGELQTFAAKTPFEFAGVADASKRILAFGQAVGITRDEVIPTLSTVGDLVSVLGGGQESIDSTLRAFGQISSKGRVQQEELLQLSEALPGFNANAAIANALGVSVPEAMAKITAGEVDATTGIAALLQGMKDFPGAAGAMEKQSQTLLGVFSTFKDTIGIALTSAFQPVIPAIKDSLTQVTPILGDAINQLAPSLGGLLAALLPALGALVQGIVPILTPVIDAIAQTVPILVPLFQPLGQAIGGVVAALAPLIPMFVKALLPVTEALIPVIASLGPVVQALAPALGEILIALIPLLPPLAQLIVAVTPLIVLVAQLVGWLVTLASKFVIAPIIQVLAFAVNLLAEALGGLVNWIKSVDWGHVWDNIVGGLKIAWDAVANFFTHTIPDKFREWFANLGPQMLAAGKSIVEGIWNGISSLGGWLWRHVTDFIHDNTIGRVESLLGINSPSTVFAEIGENVVAGYVQGVENSARSASMATTAALAPATVASTAAAPAAQTPIPVRADDALVAGLFALMRRHVGSTYGNDPVFALSEG